jgi:tetratricopeptide (TPR) repeat protein
MSAACLWSRALAFAGAYYVLMLVPILGFLNIYFFRFSQVADHYQYFAIPAATCLVAAIVFRLAGVAGIAIARTIGGVLVACLALLTWRQCRIYSDAQTLWRDTLAHDPASFLAANNLGEQLLRRGAVDEAIGLFETALRANPGSTEALNNLGNVQLKKGQLDSAVALYHQALQTNPNSPDPHFNLGNALVEQGKLEEAAGQFLEAARLKPNHAEALYNLANVLLRQGRVDEALTEYERSLRIDASSSEVENNYATALLRKNRSEEAVIHFQKALATLPMSCCKQAEWMKRSCTTRKRSPRMARMFLPDSILPPPYCSGTD